jgi:hypothetical protein
MNSIKVGSPIDGFNSGMMYITVSVGVSQARETWIKEFDKKGGK